MSADTLRDSSPPHTTIFLGKKVERSHSTSVKRQLILMTTRSHHCKQNTATHRIPRILYRGSHQITPANIYHSFLESSTPACSVHLLRPSALQAQAINNGDTAPQEVYLLPSPGHFVRLAIVLVAFVPKRKPGSDKGWTKTTTIQPSHTTTTTRNSSNQRNT